MTTEDTANGLAGRRILVVEDEMLVAMMLEDMLQDLGCSVVGPVGSVSLALPLARPELCDAAILDVNLEGEDSYPVAAALRAHGIPFIFSTGYDDLRDDFMGSQTLQKPYQQSQLARALKRLVEG